ncbi:transposase [Brevundimonas sp. SORGH_AS 993]|nr:transposase [Brevundimonas sp. SORGH_AS_0993]
MGHARRDRHPAHAQAAGARLKRGADAQALGRSRGGFGTNIHVCVDALGLPVRILLGPGQQNDMAPACDLIDGLAAQNVLADKAYDGDRLYKKIIDQGGDPVVPPRRHRKRQHTYEADLYKERNRVERFFSHIKHFRRVATRYDKLASNFKGFTTLASIMLWLK